MSVKFKPDPSFCYTPAFETDVRKTFARIRDSLNQKSKEADTRAAVAGSIFAMTAHSGRTELKESVGRKQ
jgi:hypothetical protein